MRFFFITLFIFFSFVQLLAEQGEQQFAELGDFVLENKECIKDARIGYRIFGNFNEAKSNVVVYLTWYGGHSQVISRLLGTGKMVDSGKYCVVVIDALGNGVSSSPSVQKVSYDHFPRFSIRDMVHSQHILLTKHLGLSHIHAIIGGSMGGMQVFEWVLSYPDFMNKAIPYVGTPRLTSYDLLLFHTLRQNLEILKKQGASETQLIHFMQMCFALCMDSAEYRVKKTSTKDFPNFFASLEKNASTTMNSDDFLSQLYAIINHDVYSRYDGSMEKAISCIQAKMLVIVSKTDRILYPEEALSFARQLGAEILLLDNELGHLAISYELPRVSKTIDEFLKK